MAVTSRGIVTPNQTDEYKLVTDLNTMATSIDEALQDAANTYRGTSTQRTQFTSQAPEGTIWVDTNGEKIVWVKQGVSWRRIWPVRQGDIPGIPYAMAAGRVTLTSGGVEVSTPVVFPPGRFTEVPLVQVTPGSASTAIAGYAAQGVTAVGMNIHFTRTNSTATELRWLAVQMAPTSAEG